MSGTDDHRDLADAVSAVLSKNPDDWATLEELGFTRLGLPEELGGSGGDLTDAAVVVAEAARHASSLPLVEALFLLNPLLARTGNELPTGNWAQLHGAAARAVQIGGAGRAVLDLSLTHTGQRVQFGKPLNHFQAVQQLLARLAADVTTVTVAADAAVRALSADVPTAELFVAAAKAEASALAVEIAKAGHQLHGAIGYAEEHPLGRHTRQLWSLRQDNGNELYWYRRIASLVNEAPSGLWPLITSTKGLTA